ncbi:MAG TPA: hypothetical protein VGD27_04725 [Longimicrobiales bacterium]
MSAMQSRREGFALAGAVLAMVLVGAIVTGGFYAAHQESRVTRSTELGDLAQYIAETGLDAVVGSVSAATLDGYAINSNTTMPSVNVQYGGRTVGNYSVVITKLTSRLFAIRSTGTVTIAQAGNATQSTRTVTNIVRVRNVDFDNETAMQVFGNLTVTGTSEVAGADTNLGVWTGCTTTAGSAAVTARPEPHSIIDEEGAGNINGDIDRAPLGSNDFTVFGDLTWSDLVSMATNVYPDGATPAPAPSINGAGFCDSSILDNWGAPTSNSHVCRNYFPIIYTPGDMHISANSTGQGILLVGGDLQIESQFQFYGPVIVMGAVDFQGGAEIIGSVFAYGGGVLGADNSTAGNMIVQYSSCAIKRATQGASGLSRAIPIRNRSWLDLTAVRNSY